MTTEANIALRAPVEVYCAADVARMRTHLKGRMRAEADGTVQWYAPDQWGTPTPVQHGPWDLAALPDHVREAVQTLRNVKSLSGHMFGRPAGGPAVQAAKQLARADEERRVLALDIIREWVVSEYPQIVEAE